MTADDVRDALRTVIDPELGLNVVDLGLVYGVDVDDGAVRLTMTMTSAACPLGESIAAESRTAIARHFPAARSVTVDLVWAPVWEPSMMSPAAKQQFGW